jgi:hypothetical protein
MLITLTDLVLLRLEAFKGFKAGRLRLARLVAAVIGILLSIAMPLDVMASIVPNKSLKELANYQLDDKQYKCHNQIVYLESRWTIDAVGNKSGNHQTHGYYQLKSKAAIDAPYDKQFYLYWYYVSGRYGLSPDNPDLPNYCLALKHLKTKGWQ